MIKAWGRVGLIVFLVLFSALLPVFYTDRVKAQEDGSLNITTSPLPINLVTTPGQTITADLRVKNSSTETEELQVGLLKFGANDTTGQPRLADREPGDDYFDWVTFSEDVFVAEPNVWHTIVMTINVPPEAGLGYYYAVTFSRSQGAGEVDQGAGLNGGTAVLVLLDVTVPYAQRKVELVEFTSAKSVYEFLPAEFTMTIKNTGNIHLIPTGSIFITRGDKQEAILNINEVRGNVLPNSVRSFVNTWDDGFPKYEIVEENGSVVKNDDGTNKTSLKWDLSQTGKLRFGKFKATALLVYDDGEKDVPVEAVITFWIIPWRIIFVGLILLSLLGLGLYVLISKIFGLGKKLPKKKAKLTEKKQNETHK